MKQFLPSRIFIALALIVGLAIVPASSSVLAQSPDASNGLEISPVLVELNGETGKNYTIDIKVRNVTKSDLYFKSSVDDFGAKDETGSPSIILEDSSEPLATSVKGWVTNIPDFWLASGDERIINANVLIPPTAEPGGHYGVIRFSGHENVTDSGNVGLIASAGTLLLVSVKGDIKESLELTSFEASKDGTTGIAFESGPITLVSRFTNTGSVHLKPVGQIEVKDAFGNSVATLPVNEAMGNVLPDSTRRFESTLDKTWLFGQYSADISIAYGNTGQAIVQNMTFWVIPWKIILVALLLLGTVLFILRAVFKRYNRYIIGKDRARRSVKTTKKRK